MLHLAAESGFTKVHPLQFQFDMLWQRDEADVGAEQATFLEKKLLEFWLLVQPETYHSTFLSFPFLSFPDWSCQCTYTSQSQRMYTKISSTRNNLQQYHMSTHKPQGFEYLITFLSSWPKNPHNELTQLFSQVY